MTTLLLLLAIFFFSIQPIAMKKIKDASLRVNILQTGLFSFVVAVCFWIWAAAAKFTFSPATIAYGALFGAGLIATGADLRPRLQPEPSRGRGAALRTRPRTGGGRR